MEEEIIAKIKSAFSSPIESECQVVYVLAEVRKFLEKKGLKKDYPVLNFYCNWVLHPEIENIADSISSLLDSIALTVSSAKYDPFLPFQMAHFEHFFSNLNLFLKNFGVSEPLGLDKRKIFKKLLRNIISECPLNSSQGRIKEFKFVNSGDEDEISFIITFADDRKMNFGFSEIDLV